MARPTIIALLLLVLGFLLLAWFLFLLIKRISFHPEAESRRKTPASVGYWGITISVIMLALSWLLFWTGGQLKSYKPFNPSSSIGTVEVWYEGDPVKTLKVEFYSNGADSLAAPTLFYLSGNSFYLKGQSIKIPDLLTYIFKWQYYYKITDFYGAFAGHKPPGVDAPLLAHQTIGSGSIKIHSLPGSIPLLGKSIETCNFESKVAKISRHNKFDLILSDSCNVVLKAIK
ncbi:MAG: hypothetical protein GY839_19920 [candidate division Zixibacteria bacterium]|nr:hypothetical protein [candidate division Zixibacteria bacterium]